MASLNAAREAFDNITRQLAALGTRPRIEQIERETLPAIAAHDALEPPTLSDFYRTFRLVFPTTVTVNPRAVQSPGPMQ